jgi:hypothetical protein
MVAPVAAALVLSDAETVEQMQLQIPVAAVVELLPDVPEMEQAVVPEL